ncbi:riboflavin synthase [Candidatus Peregrinibacteria bacterium]|nr:riboflavin synthase [Candidatus Peregrinibacteria bacterium]
MFNGLIKNLGKVSKIVPTDELYEFTIKSPIAVTKKNGDSIAVDGACFTVISTINNEFSFQAMPESLNLTILHDYQPGTLVNLENPLTLSQFIDGHLVQGHIDGTGTVKKISQQGSSSAIQIEAPSSILSMIALKGSIAINGVSLTVSGLSKKYFEVSLIPSTLKSTNLGKLKPGMRVNLEIDLISRYIERQIQKS